MFPELPRIDIYRAQKLAEEHGFDSCTMTALNSHGAVIRLKWLDAYMGLVAVEGKEDEGFLTIQDLDITGIQIISVFGPNGRCVSSPEGPQKGPDKGT